MRLHVLPADGIGPEITEAAIAVLDVADRRFELGLSYEYDEVGLSSLKLHGTTMREEIFQKSRSLDGVILGTQSHMDYPPPAQGGRNISAAYRVGYDLYANVRPARTRAFLGKGAAGMDLVIMREATEGFYSDRNMHAGTGEFMPSPDMAMAVRKITAHASNRIVRRAFEVASRRRKKVTAAHKANCFHLSCGLFLREARKVAAEFPEVAYEEVIVDAMAALLVRQPEKYDVIVTTNLFADILSDLASELSGSLGLAGSTNESDLYCCAQAQHGSAPDIAGKNIANPTSMILSIAMLCDWLGTKHGRPEFNQAAAAMERAIDTVLADPASRTRDLGGTMACDAFAKTVARVVKG
jgi:3-isopropylmalate dehydrogenase